MKQLLLLCSATGLLLSSCVSSKKFEQATNDLTEAKAENQRLLDEKNQQAQKITVYEAEAKQLKEENIAYGKEAEMCRKTKEALAARKRKLDEELAARGTSLSEIEAKANASVANLRQAGCEVTYSNGRYHIIVPDEFTFKSGGTTIGAKGREALNVVAQVMYDNPGVITTIIGNTDTLSVKGKGDNWSLSTERANAVVRILADVYNINPKRLVAAGRSKFNPIAPNSTTEGREKNRRIEIDINPRFDRIWELMAEPE
jgi:chemotaxis protein MotB